MPVLELEFEVFCGTCGEGLCNNSTEGSNNHSQYISIDPCERCLAEALEEGREEGYNQCKEENDL